MPAADDFEVGRFRDVLTFSSLYFLGAFVLDHIGISPHVFEVLHHVLGPPALAVAVYAAAWVLFGSVETAILAALLLSFADYAWFRANVGYPILFNQSLYYGDVNHVFAAAIIASLLARRFMLAAVASVALSLMNATYGFNGVLCIGAVWVASRAAGWRDSQFSRALAVSVGGLCAGYGLPILTGWMAPPEEAAPAAARDVAIRTYGHIAIHSSDMILYVLGIGALLAVLTLIVVLERYGTDSRFGGRRPWFELIARAMLGVVILQGLFVYWALFIGWPTGFIAASPSKIFMFAAIFACPYIAYGAARAAAVAVPWGTALVVLGAITLSTRGSLVDVWVVCVLLTICAALPLANAVINRARVRAGAWVLIAILVFDLGVVTARPFTSGLMSLAMELKDISLRIRADVPANAVLVPFRIGNPTANPLGPFTNLALRTFSRRAYLPYWSVGRNAYFDSIGRHRAEERAFAAAGLVFWPTVLSTLDRERQARPFEYYTGIRLDAMPCCHVSVGVPIPTRVLVATHAALERYVSGATPRQFAGYAARLGGTHLFVSKDTHSVAPWGPILVESPHFLVIPIPPDLTAEANR